MLENWTKRGVVRLPELLLPLPVLPVLWLMKGWLVPMVSRGVTVPLGLSTTANPLPVSRAKLVARSVALPELFFCCPPTRYTLPRMNTPLKWSRGEGNSKIVLLLEEPLLPLEEPLLPLEPEEELEDVLRTRNMDEFAASQVTLLLRDAPPEEAPPEDEEEESSVELSAIRSSTK